MQTPEIGSHPAVAEEEVEVGVEVEVEEEEGGDDIR